MRNEIQDERPKPPTRPLYRWLKYSFFALSGIGLVLLWAGERMDDKPVFYAGMTLLVPLVLLLIAAHYFSIVYSVWEGIVCIYTAICDFFKLIRLAIRKLFGM